MFIITFKVSGAKHPCLAYSNAMLFKAAEIWLNTPSTDTDATLRQHAIPSCAHSTVAPSAPAPIYINAPLSFFMRNASRLSLRTVTETYLAVLEEQHAYWESKDVPSLAYAILVGFDRPKGQVAFKLRSEEGDAVWT